MIKHEFSAAVTTVAEVSKTPSLIALMELANTTGAMAYLQIFWKASADVVLGTTVPNAVIALPPNGGAVLPFEEPGWATNGTAWSIAGTTDRGNAVTAAISVTIWKY